MQAWQRKLVAQIAAEVDAHTAGTISTKQLLERSMGLMEAADLKMTSVWDAFQPIWSRVDAEHELLTEPWAPTGSGSQDRLEAAALKLRAWAIAAGRDA
jgi:hypothetical protein